MKCPTCSQSELIHDTRAWPVTYKGKTTQIPDVEADWCDACAEVLTGPEQSQRIMETIKAFRQRCRYSVEITVPN